MRVTIPSRYERSVRMQTFCTVSLLLLVALLGYIVVTLFQWGYEGPTAPLSAMPMSSPSSSASSSSTPSATASYPTTGSGHGQGVGTRRDEY